MYLNLWFPSTFFFCHLYYLSRKKKEQISYISSVHQSLSHIQLFTMTWIAACQASLSITISRSSLRLTSIESVMPSNHLILSHPLLLLPTIPPSVRVFSNESTLNAEFKRRARRDKKAFFSDQCKEIEENNRMGKTRDLFKKIRDAKGTFHAKMGSIKDRSGINLTEAEDLKKRWQVQKRSSWPRWSWWCDHSPRARHPGMWSQVGLRKHHYKQS